MARARNIKPGFFKNEVLAKCDPLTRILFAGLWTLADREGRLEDRPMRIKAELIPYDNCDIEKMLNDLIGDFILRYEVEGKKYIQILNFIQHQNPHQKEAVSTIPAPDSPGAKPMQAGPLTDSPIPITDSPIPYPSPRDLTEAVAVYNSAAKEVGWPECQRLTEPRKASLKARLEEVGSLEGWSLAIERARSSPFLVGENEKGWKADFDFLLKAAKFTKLMEGSYDRREGQPVRARGDPAAQRMQIAAEVAATRRQT